MVRVRYIPNQGALDDYYKRQSGRGDPYFQGPVYQRGHGLGGLFGKLFRAAVPLFKSSVAPMLKRGAKAVAREALSTGVGVANDMLDGRNGVASLQRRLPTAANRLASKGVRKMARMLNEPQNHRPRAKKRRTGSGKGRKSIKGTDIFRK